MRAEAAQCASAMKEMYDAELAAGTSLQQQSRNHENSNSDDKVFTFQAFKDMSIPWKNRNAYLKRVLKE